MRRPPRAGLGRETKMGFCTREREGIWEKGRVWATVCGQGSRLSRLARPEGQVFMEGSGVRAEGSRDAGRERQQGAEPWPLLPGRGTACAQLRLGLTRELGGLARKGRRHRVRLSTQGPRREARKRKKRAVVLAKRNPDCAAWS